MSDDEVHPLLQDCDIALLELHRAMCALLGELTARQASDKQLHEARAHLCKHLGNLLFRISCNDAPHLTLDCLPDWALDRLGLHRLGVQENQQPGQ